MREARLQLALAPHGVRLPTIRAVCEDETVIGVPFYVMDFLEGRIFRNARLPGMAPVRLYATAEDVFYLRTMLARVTFSRGSSGGSYGLRGETTSAISCACASNCVRSDALFSAS